MFSGAERGRAFGIFGTTVGVSAGARCAARSTPPGALLLGLAVLCVLLPVIEPRVTRRSGCGGWCCSPGVRAAVRRLGAVGGTSGLSVMPFAVGSATSSVLAGRVVHRRGRWVTVSGLLVVTAGFLALAVAVPATLPHHAALVA
ncbi:MAG: hypothetical protein ACXVXD_16735, partial [Nocardioidaceae bacterium]